jgi:hypothetical protein
LTFGTAEELKISVELVVGGSSSSRGGQWRSIRVDSRPVALLDSDDRRIAIARTVSLAATVGTRSCYRELWVLRTRGWWRLWWKECARDEVRDMGAARGVVLVAATATATQRWHGRAYTSLRGGGSRAEG